MRVDRKNKEIHVYIRDNQTNKTYEVYAHTLGQLAESYVKSFDSFIVKD
jgi:hypothetical protein